MTFNKVTCLAAVCSLNQKFEEVQVRWDRHRRQLSELPANDSSAALALRRRQLLGFAGSAAEELYRLALDIARWYVQLHQLEDTPPHDAGADTWRAIGQRMRSHALDAHVQRLHMVTAAVDPSLRSADAMHDQEQVWGDIARLGNPVQAEFALLAILNLRQRHYGVLSEAAAHAHWLLALHYDSLGRDENARQQRNQEEAIRNRYRVR